MKCPKCGYIGFEHTDRCRNCGYDFVLADGAAAEPELAMRSDEAAPLADFDLGESRRSAPAEDARPARRRHDPDFDPRITPPGRPAAADLPLFGEGGDDLPIVPASAPTPPLAVRRSQPLAAKARPRPTPRSVDVPVSAPLPLSEGNPLDGAPATPAAADAGGASAGPRLLAALVDALLLLGTDAVVVYFTLQICRLSLAEIGSLELPPLVAFLLMLNGGYLVLLTAAGGQTLGKMAFGLKVVGVDDRPVTVGRCLARTAALLLGALPAGLGLLPALFTAGHRGLHDRLADTRVIRAHGA